MTNFNLRRQYIRSWLEFIKDNPDYPLRKNYPTKRAYRKDKDAWNKAHSDISVFLATRFISLLSQGFSQLACLYPQNYSEDLKRGLATLATPKLDIQGASLTHQTSLNK